MPRSIDNAKSRGARQHVALIIETSHASGREVLQGVAQFIREGAHWSVYHEPRGLEGDLPSWIGDWQGDGIIVRAQNPQIAAGVLRTGLPAVDVLGMVENSGLPLVHVSNQDIARIAAEHFFERGYKRFAYCGLDGVNWSIERGRAFEEIVTKKTYSFEQFLLQQPGVTESWEQEQDRLGAWLRSLLKPVAVMVCNDPRGQRVLEAARRVGALVPEEIAVIGVDNDETLCEISDPPLSSVIAGHHGVGYQAATQLFKMMSGEPPPENPTYVQPIGCVARRSSDVFAVDDEEVVKAVAFIREQACYRISVEDVVEHVSISRSALKRRFAKHLSRGIHDEITRVRMDRAKMLLSETNLSIDNVAIRIGYEHVEYFSVAFRRETGESPGAYRKRVHRRSGTAEI